VEDYKQTKMTRIYFTIRKRFETKSLETYIYIYIYIIDPFCWTGIGVPAPDVHDDSSVHYDDYNIQGVSRFNIFLYKVIAILPILFTLDTVYWKLHFF